MSWVIPYCEMPVLIYGANGFMHAMSKSAFMALLKLLFYFHSKSWLIYIILFVF